MSQRPVQWIEMPEEVAEALGDPAVSLPASAAVVKENAQRVIYRVHLAGKDLHVKLCRTRGWRARLRQWLRGPKALLEYAKILAATARQVPTVPAVAAGARAGESVLVTETVAGAVPLAQFLAGPLDAGARIRLSVALGRFLARVHHAGVLHPDLHPGNILVRAAGGDPELFLLDLHDARIGRPVGERASVANLVVFNRWFILRTNRSDRLRFWRAYVVERLRLAGTALSGGHQSPGGSKNQGPDGPRSVAACGSGIDYCCARDVEQRTWTSNLQFWRGRVTRCLGTNRRFRRIRGADVAGFAVAELSDEDLAPLLRDPDALFCGGPLLKDSRSSTVAVRELSVNGVMRHVVCKRFRCPSLTDAAAALVRPTACRRSWVNGHAFLDCLLPTARPLAMVHRYRSGLPHDGYLITGLVPGAVDLRTAVQEPAQCLKRERIDMVARLVRRLHERGWWHRDLKAANILLARGRDGHEAAWFIDLAGARRPPRLTRARRVKDLARLNASFHDLPQLSRADRLRFLRLYLNWDLHGRGDWKSWWHEIESGSRRKVAKNRRRGRPLA